MSSGSPSGVAHPTAGPPWGGVGAVCPLMMPLPNLLPRQMSVFLYILAARASCAAQRQGFEKKGPV